MAKKYIDSEKLIAEIEKRIIEHRKSLKKDITSISEATLKGSLCAYKSIEHFIDSLQQEQPEVELGGEITRFLSKATKMNKGEWRGKYAISEIGFRAVAHHFYELGLNARKENQ